MASVDDIAAAAGRARDAGYAGELSLQIAGIGDDIPAWLRGQGMTPEQVRGKAAFLSGDPAEDAASLQALRERTEVSYITAPVEFADRLAPLVQLLAGQ